MSTEQPTLEQIADVPEAPSHLALAIKIGIALLICGVITFAIFELTKNCASGNKGSVGCKLGDAIDNITKVIKKYFVWIFLAPAIFAALRLLTTYALKKIRASPEAGSEDTTNKDASESAAEAPAREDKDDEAEEDDEEENEDSAHGSDANPTSAAADI